MADWRPEVGEAVAELMSEGYWIVTDIHTWQERSPLPPVTLFILGRHGGNAWEVMGAVAEDLRCLQVALLAGPQPAAIQPPYAMEYPDAVPPPYNVWLHLPLFPGNHVMIYQAFDPASLHGDVAYHPGMLLMYPSVLQNGCGLVFHSGWSGDTITLEFTDVLKSCPRNHYWPFCTACNKFLFPADGHRASQGHQRKLRNTIGTSLAYNMAAYQHSACAAREYDFVFRDPESSSSSSSSSWNPPPFYTPPPPPPSPPPFYTPPPPPPPPF